jgi:hypothetical protein
MMKNRSRKFVGFLHRHRSLAPVAVVMAAMVILTGMALQPRPHTSDHQLLCSLKSGANRGKLLSRSVFDSRSAASRIDRIVSGAFRFASSL